MNTTDNTLAKKLAKNSYQAISETAGSNTFMQGLSGLFGFPWTLITDVGVLFTHYGPMINKLRGIYGRNPVDSKLKDVLVNVKEEVLFDIVVDKVLGNIPLLGVYFNAICAKAMTWRIGMLFSIMSSRGEEIDAERAADVMKLVRLLSPQNSVFKFQQPSYAEYEKILVSVYNNDADVFGSKIERALDIFS